MTAPEGVVVLGMHRSGTSAATRLINMLGPSLCHEDDLMGSLEGNETGHWESVAMTALNERLLAEMGRAWWCPPPDARALYAEAEQRIVLDPAEAAAAFDAVHPTRPWVWKDPRTCLTLPFWRAALDRPFAVVFVYRNPVEVAMSLRERNVFTLPRSVATWERYNRIALAHCTGLPVHVTRYDDLVTDPVSWCKQVHTFLESCGLATTMPAAQAIESFVEPQLRHSEHDHDDIVRHYRASLPVFEALESRRGSWASFEPLPLPPEPSWVEAEFVAIGSIQPEPLPQPLHPYTSIVMMALGRPLAPALASLDEHLQAFAEGILVTDSTSPLPPDRTTSVHVIRVAPGTTTGAARAEAVSAATTDLLEFRDYGVKEHSWWYVESRRAFAAGYSGVTPQITSSRGGGGCGLARSGEGGAVAWQRPPAEKLAEVELLGPQCFVVRREAVDAVGGFDRRQPAADDEDELNKDVYELCDRLRSAGHQLGAARDGRIEVPDEGLWPRGKYAAAASTNADPAAATNADPAAQSAGSAPGGGMT
jgi:hypothetical protein